MLPKGARVDPRFSDMKHLYQFESPGARVDPEFSDMSRHYKSQPPKGARVRPEFSDPKGARVLLGTPVIHLYQFELPKSTSVSRQHKIDPSLQIRRIQKSTSHQVSIHTEHENRTKKIRHKTGVAASPPGPPEARYSLGPEAGLAETATSASP